MIIKKYTAMKKILSLSLLLTAVIPFYGQSDAIDNHSIVISTIFNHKGHKGHKVCTKFKLKKYTAMKKILLLSLLLTAVIPFYGQSDTQGARKQQSTIVNQQSTIPNSAPPSARKQQSTIVNQQSTIPIEIEGTWVLDTAIISQTCEDGSISDTSIYLLGDTLVTAWHPQPPQRVVITSKEVIFEYSSPIACRSIIEHIRVGEYSFDGSTLRICFLFYEEYICSRYDKEHLHLHYTCFLADDVHQFIEHGVFKFKSADTIEL
jgi:hypothetical protein